METWLCGQKYLQCVGTWINLQYPCKNQTHGISICYPKAPSGRWEVKTKEFLEAVEATSLTREANLSKEPFSNNVEGEDQHPRLTSDLHTYNVACMCLHSHMNAVYVAYTISSICCSLWSIKVWERLQVPECWCRGSACKGCSRCWESQRTAPHAQSMTKDEASCQFLPHC